MTSKVTVTAHCGPTKEVQMLVHTGFKSKIDEKIILQDGQTAERYIYEDRSIEVFEVEK